jgi:endonuclease/exonuclease/phosphatase family metal-dependent hydrolase
MNSRALIVVLLLLTACSPVLTGQHTIERRDTSGAFTVANWNLHGFGVEDGQDAVLLTQYSDVIAQYDIVFLQEIRNEEAFYNLCRYLGAAYQCEISSPAGIGSYKEMYGVAYRREIDIINWVDLSEMEAYELWARPPLVVTFNASNYTFTAWNIHIDPDQVEYELGNLESNVIGDGNLMILGDLNADCGYYSPEDSAIFLDWTWVIEHDADTNVAKSACAYDRIIVNKAMTPTVVDAGVHREGIDATMSDHYLVWVAVKPQ